MESDASCRKVSSCFLYDEAYLSQPGIIFVIREIQAGQNIVDKEHACDALYPCASNITWNITCVQHVCTAAGISINNPLLILEAFKVRIGFFLGEVTCCLNEEIPNPN